MTEEKIFTSEKVMHHKVEERRRILVVDDDYIIGEMLKFMLEFDGYEVWVSQGPGETVQNILDNGIDLVILDKLLSGMDGTTICTGIKENKTRHMSRC